MWGPEDERMNGPLTPTSSWCIIIDTWFCLFSPHLIASLACTSPNRTWCTSLPITLAEVANVTVARAQGAAMDLSSFATVSIEEQQEAVESHFAKESRRAVDQAMAAAEEHAKLPVHKRRRRGRRTRKPRTRSLGAATTHPLRTQ